MLDDNEYSVVIMDNGSRNTRIGLSGDEAPRKEFRTMIGYSRFQGLEIALDETNFVIGDEAFKKRGTLNIEYPVEKGIIKDFNSMEKFWHQSLYNELKVDPQKHPVLLSESPTNQVEKKETTTEIFFENFNVPSFFMMSQSVLSLISQGITKGVVLDSGDGKTHVVPIYEGYSLPFSIEQLDICGKDVTNNLMELLIKTGMTFSRDLDYEIINEIKEKKCYISKDYNQELIDFVEKANSKEVLFDLPDGESINIGSPQIEATEILFNPSLIGRDIIGIPELIYKSYFSIDVDIRKDLFNNIYLTGGNTMFDNFTERVSAEIKNLGGNSVNYKIYSPGERKYSVWIGGSILSSLSTFSSMWISKSDYDEIGPNCVNIKCF